MSKLDIHGWIKTKLDIHAWIKTKLDIHGWIKTKQEQSRRNKSKAITGMNHMVDCKNVQTIDTTWKKLWNVSNIILKEKK